MWSIPRFGVTVQGLSAIRSHRAGARHLPPVLRYEETELAETSSYEAGFHIERGDDGVFDVSAARWKSSRFPDPETNLHAQISAVAVKTDHRGPARDGREDGDAYASANGSLTS
jgi:hypothetical protein